uniref:Uncharacterized protein n=1 Tax=Candidatus Kentrum sp. LPFa TaxID=2126335 RepID=A0A450WVQ4_9GAMM|nr:MAG: hypothetical protein BECKLPF1236B_GA0070989_12373 [Candidatus Kentron sp. LPFa]
MGSAGIKPSERTWDFLVIALGVIAADFGCERENSPDGWTREISLEVSVLAPDFWSTRRADIEEALAYLSGDIWRLEFGPGGASPPVLTSGRERKTEGDCVCLLSGGADSLVGGNRCRCRRQNTGSGRPEGRRHGKTEKVCSLTG